MSETLSQIIYASKTPGVAAVAGAALDTWELAAADGQAIHNGIVDSSTSAVIALYYNNHTLYRVSGTTTTFGNPGWYSWSGTTWVAVSCPITESAEGLTVSSPGAIIFASQSAGTAAAAGTTLDTFMISGNGLVNHNSVNDATTSSVTELYYHNHRTYYQSVLGNSSGTPGWWSWNGSGWSIATNPVVVTTTISVAAIGNQTANTAFTVTGSLGNYGTTVPTLQYQDNGTGSWIALPAGSSVLSTSFTFQHPGMVTTANATVSVWDANNITTVGTSNIFAVTAVSQIILNSISLSNNSFSPGAAPITVGTTTVGTTPANSFPGTTGTLTLSGTGAPYFAVGSDQQTITTAQTTTAGSSYTVTFTTTLPGATNSPLAVTQTLTAQALRNFAQSPGMDGSFWVQPFYSSATWTTTGTGVTSLRKGVVNVKGNYSVPWVIGQATDPLVTVTNGTKSIQVHIPLGTVVEGPTSSFDQSIGGADMTQPYLVWSISGATINTGSVAASGSVITGTYGMQIDDGSGQIMTDAITGQPGTNNSIGGIQDYELTLANASSSYVIQHMLAWTADVSQVNATGAPVWPLKIVDTSLTTTGVNPQGQTIGIPSTTARPTGMTRGFYLLFDNLQQYGWLMDNIGQGGATTIEVYSNLSANSALVTDIQNSINSVMQYVCILNNQTGLSSIKGFTTGATAAYPPPPLLDLTPTGGVNVLPSTFGAWYPSGYNAMPTNTPTGTQTVTINSVTLNGNTFTAGVSPITVGSVTVVTTPTGGFPGTSGAFIISGTDASYFTVSGTTLQTKATTTARTYSIVITVTLSGAASVSSATLTITGTAVSSNFTIIGGKVYDPTGNLFIARGINVNDSQMATVSTGTSGAPLTTLFPGINFIRLACYSYQAPSYYTTFISQMTALKIVVEIEDHTNSTGADGGGAVGVVYTGTLLTNELAWYSTLASAFASNPYVWYGTDNEPAYSPSLAALSTWHQQTYNAIRTTGGASNIILIDLPGGGNPGTYGSSSGMTVSVYAPMTGVIWDMHQYSWIYDGGTPATLVSQATIQAAMLTQITTAQTIPSANGTMPVICAEYGISTDGVNLDASGTNLVAAVIANCTATGGFCGSAAWHWGPQDAYNNLSSSNSGGTLTAFGTQVAAFIAAGTKPRVTAPLTGTVTKGTWVANQSFAATMPGGGGSLRWNYLMPAQFSTTVSYPVLFYGHTNDSGMNGSSYPQDGPTLVTDLSISPLSIDGSLNTVAFRTAFPCIVVVPECDQTLDSSGANGNANFGGYADTPNSGQNEQAVIALLKYILATTSFSADPTRCYCTGDSLGAIGTLAWLVDNNQVNGVNKLWTAGMGFSDQLYRPSIANSTVFPNMVNVPYIAVSTSGDNNQAIYDEAGWTYYTGNTNYPTPSTLTSGGVAAIRAGTSSFYYINNGATMPWATYRQINADGGQGTALYTLLFSFIGTSSGGGTGPTIITRTSGGSVSDAAGNVWTLTSAGVVMESLGGTGTPFAVAGGAGTSEITSVGGVIYGQDASTLTWYYWNGTTWVATTQPF
jgi:hypothetical protein